MRTRSSSGRRQDHEIEELLAELRDRVARLRRLESATPDRAALDDTRRSIADLQWQLSRLVGDTAA